MKIKLSKTIAVILALCVIFAGFSAFAADASVKMVTTYDYNAKVAADEAETAYNVSVTTTVSNMAADDEVTYYVSDGSNIVYINQLTADENGVAAFPTFTAAWSNLLKSNVIIGSDADYNNAKDPLTFVEGGNAKQPGTPTATATADDPKWEEVTDGEIFEDGELEAGVRAYKFEATVTGNYSEYGVRATIDGGTRVFPAMGCDADGSYVIVIKGEKLEPTSFGATEAYAN